MRQKGTPGDWSHVVNQTGMFCILGLNKDQVRHLQGQFPYQLLGTEKLNLVDQHHVYMAGNSRISMAGLNVGNVQYFGQALDETVRSVL